MIKEQAMERFTNPLSRPRLEPAKGSGTLCGALIETCDKSGLAKSIEPVRVGPNLSPTHTF